MITYVYLLVAIISEVIATSFLKASAGFTRFYPSLAVVIGYAISFTLLSLVLKSIPVGIAYAIWAGLGIVLVAVSGYIFFGQRLDGYAIAGIALIISGVLIINLLSTSTGH